MAYEEYLSQVLFFMNFKVWFYRVDTCKSGFTKTERHFRIFKNWLFWLHWNEIFIPQMLSSVAINYSY